MVNQNGTVLLGASINSSLGPLFSVLNHAKRGRDDDLLGAGLFSVGQIHAKLRQFKQLHLSTEPQTIYFVKADVRSCFDSIPQEELVRYMRRLQFSHRYLVKRYAEITASDPRWSGTDGKPYRKFLAIASPAGRDLAAETPSASLARRHRSVLVETGFQKLHDTRELLKLLEEHVKRNLVKIGKKYYRQKQGIPQGSVVSSLLCNLFYASFERARLDFLGEDSLLLRLIDDFLLITTNPSHARQFLQIMSDGSSQFGITTNPAKSLVNFDVSINGARVPRLQGTRTFPYCGMLIDIQSLEVTKDRQRLDGTVSHSLTVEVNRTPGKTFQRRVLAAFKIQVHAMVVDTTLNSPSTVLSSFHQIYVETAMKLYSYLKVLGPRWRSLPQLIIQTCIALVRLAANLTRGPRRTRQVEHYECRISQTQHSWLMAVAFETVLGRKGANFAPALHWLRALRKQSQECLGHHDQRSLQLQMAGAAVFRHYQY